ncbi:hypothetical protein K0M31_001201 [Melipona bicolor]|uniref:Uncharacterized protein n=1 Tax=Melipona bicolor TaxID=60889 RepID=A0AA40GFD4_9HYME|nr:hypothetical protein K0M31_001201 [Melipona bicolor]
MQLDPNVMVEDEYKEVNDGNFGWRALRLLARCSLHFLFAEIILLLPEYLETTIKKISKNRPQIQSDIKLETEETPEVNDQEFNKDVMKQESEVENTDTKGRKLTKVTPGGEIIRNSEKRLVF